MSLTNALKRLERDGKLPSPGTGEATDAAAPADPNLRSEKQVMDLIDHAEASLDAALAEELPRPTSADHVAGQSPSSPVSSPVSSSAYDAAAIPSAITAPPSTMDANADRDQRAWEDADDLEDDEPAEYTDGLGPSQQLTAQQDAAQQDTARQSEPPLPATPPSSASAPRQDLLDAEAGVLSTWAELARLVQQAGDSDPLAGPIAGPRSTSAYAPVILPIDDLLFDDEESVTPSNSRLRTPDAPRAAQPPASQHSATQDSAAVFPRAMSVPEEIQDDARHEEHNDHESTGDDDPCDADDDQHDILSMHRLDELERLAREYADASEDGHRSDRHREPTGPGMPHAHEASHLVMDADMEAIFRSLGVVGAAPHRMDDELDEMLTAGTSRRESIDPATPVGSNTAEAHHGREADDSIATEPERQHPATDALAKRDSQDSPIEQTTVAPMSATLGSEAALDRVFHDSVMPAEPPVIPRKAVPITDFERRIAAGLQHPAIQGEMEQIADRLRGVMRGDLPETMGCVAPRPTGRTADVLAQLAMWLGPLDEDVLLVDANLADQSLTRGLRAIDEPGLCEVLSKRINPWDSVRPTSQPHLWLVPSGDDTLGLSRIPNQIDLQHLEEMLQFWKTYFHRVFVDLGSVQSTLVDPFSRALDSTVLVVTGSRAALNQAKDAAEQMRGLGKPPVGCIMTDMPMSMLAQS